MPCGFDRTVERAFAGRFIRPLSTLVDPGLDDVEHVWSERSVGRHFQPVPVTHESKVKMAGLAVSNRSLVCSSTAERIATTLQSDPVFLLLGPMTPRAVRLEERLDVGRHVRNRLFLGEHYLGRAHRYKCGK